MVKKIKYIKVQVSMPNAFFASTERIADLTHRTKSELIREALRLYMEQQGFVPEDRIL